MSTPWSPATTPTRHGKPTSRRVLADWANQFFTRRIVPFLHSHNSHLSPPFHGYGDKKEVWREKGDNIQCDEDTMAELSPEGGDVACILSGGPVIAVRLVCLSYTLHKLRFLMKNNIG